MKKKKVFRYVGIVFAIMLMFTACGAKSDSKSSSYEGVDSGTETGSTSSKTKDASDGEIEMSADMENSGDGDLEEKMQSVDDSKQSSTADGIENSSSLTSKQLQSLTQEKIIKNFDLKVETQDFETLIKNINDKINSMGGYVEKSSISGNSYYDSSESRSGDIIARIPSSKVDEFVGAVSEKANVISNESNTENVTLEYIDAQSRIKTLKIEQDRLFAILEKTEKLDNIITLESRLSEIRYELQNYESQLRAFDNKVEYSTVTMNIQEVERIKPVTKKKPTFASRVSEGFSDTIYNISEGFKNFMVWLIVNLPYLLIWGVIIFIAVIIIRKVIKKYDVKKDDDQQNK